MLGFLAGVLLCADAGWPFYSHRKLLIVFLIVKELFCITPNEISRVSAAILKIKG